MLGKVKHKEKEMEEATKQTKLTEKPEEQRIVHRLTKQVFNSETRTMEWADHLTMEDSSVVKLQHFRLERLLAGGQHVLICGPPQSGKTKLLQYMVQELVRFDAKLARVLLWTTRPEEWQSILPEMACFVEDEEALRALLLALREAKTLLPEDQLRYMVVVDVGADDPCALAAEVGAHYWLRATEGTGVPCLPGYRYQFVRDMRETATDALAFQRVCRLSRAITQQSGWCFLVLDNQGGTSTEKEETAVGVASTYHMVGRVRQTMRAKRPRLDAKEVQHELRLATQDLKGLRDLLMEHDRYYRQFTSSSDP